VSAIRYVVIGALSILLVGCDSKEKMESWNLVTASNGLVYRINKQTGEVSVVAGTQMTKLDDLREQKKDTPKKTYFREWPVQKIKSLGDISLSFKTTWRDGKLHYILEVSPYSSQIQKEAEGSFSEARFNLKLYDTDGFELFSLPVKISEMTGVVDDAGKRNSMRANGSIVCSVDTYEALSGAGAGWAGFSKESP
jgi:hypothetical protein